MNKYENAKILRPTKARKQALCESCGTPIEKGQQYFRECIGPMAKPPNVQLKSYCLPCGNHSAGKTTRA